MASKFNHANFAIGTVSGTFTAIATTINLTTGHGNRFPTAPFRVTLWNSTDFSNPAEAYWAGEAEIIECGGKTANSITTLTRGCEGTTGIASTAGKVYRITNGFSNADLLYAFTDIKNVVSYGAIGDGVADDTDAIQDAIDACTYGGTVFIPNGTYKVGKLTVVKSGVNIIGESPQGTILSRTLGSTGTYTIDVDLSGSVKPFDFSCGNFSIQGDISTRLFHGIYLRQTWSGELRNIYFRGLDNLLTGYDCYFMTISNIFMEYYNTGIQGYSLAHPANNNTFTNIWAFEGNSDASAIPLDTTYMNHNTFISLCSSQSPSTGMDCFKLLGTSGNTYISCRWESIYSVNDWIRVGSNNKFLGCLFTTAAALAAGKYAIVVEGNNNYFRDVQLSFYGNVIKLKKDTTGNEVYFDNTYTQSHFSNVDYGSGNILHYGPFDHISGNKLTWSEKEIVNLFTNPQSFADVVLDGLTRSTTTEIGPQGIGSVYKFDTPTGNRRFYQTYGSFADNNCHVFSIWVKAVDSGVTNEETIKLLSDELLGDWTDYIVRDDCWTRLVYVQCYNDNLTRYAGITLGVGSNGIYCFGPQVIYCGGGDGTYFPPYYPGEYSLGVKIIGGRKVFGGIAAPTTGIHSVGDECRNIAPAEEGWRGWVCITAPCTWAGYGAVEALP